MKSDGQVIIVTGAASGIGRELCHLFGRRGAKIGLIDREEGRLATVADELRQHGVSCAAVAVDVTQHMELRIAVRQIVGVLGNPDILITCAGICRASTVEELRISDAEDIIRINFFGTVYSIAAVLHSMLERRSGHIVVMSSMAGLRGIPFEPAYSASKAAVAAYLESLRVELRRRGITVTTVFPGYVQTSLLEEINGMMGADMSAGKAFTAKAAAVRIVRGIERQNSYIYFPRLLGLKVRLSRVMPARFYDRVMAHTFGPFPISRVQAPASD